MAGGTITLPGGGYPNDQPNDHLFTFGDAVGFDASASVFVRQRWGDEWQPNDKLVCTSVTWAASPTIPTAELVYRYGQTLERNSTVNVRPKLALGGWYVRIEVACQDGIRLWHGFIDDIGDEVDGFVLRDGTGGSGAGGTDPNGTLTFSCVGMIAALDRSPILNCYFKTTFYDQGFGLDQMRVANSAPYFNPKIAMADEKGHQKQIKNRTRNVSDVPPFQPSTPPTYPLVQPDPSRQSYIFLWSNVLGLLETPENYWSPRDVVKYLLAFHGPKDEAHKERIPVWLYEDDDISEFDRPLPTWGQPELDCDGLTLKDALDRIMSIKNSLGYWTWVDDRTNRLMIEPFTTLESDLNVGSISTIKTIKANSRWFDVMAARDPATASSVQASVANYANQIIVRGAKRIAVCTLKMERTIAINSDLAPGWKSSEQIEYQAEFPTLGANETLRSIYARNDALEQGRYRPIYRNWIVGTNWDWRVSEGEFGVPLRWDIFRNDTPDPSGIYAVDNNRYLPHPLRVRFLSKLPLKEGIDYAIESFGNDSPEADAIREEHLASVRPFRDLEAYGKLHGENFDLAVGMTGKPVLWSAKSKRYVLYDTNDPDYYFDLRPLENDYGLGVSVNVIGASQTVFAGEVGPDVPPMPRNALEFTLAMEDDRDVMVHWPNTSASVDGVLRRVFEFGEKYQLIEILGGTALGVKATTDAGTTTTKFQRAADRYFVRDDRPLMLELAKQLHKWYSTPRNIARISSRRCTAKIWPGQLIKKLNPTTSHESISNCVITEVSLRLPIGTPDNPGKPTFAIVTSRGEVDPLFFEPRLK